MRQRPDRVDNRYDTPAEERAEAMLGGFLQRHPRFLLYAGLTIAGVIVAACIIAWFGGRH